MRLTTLLVASSAVLAMACNSNPTWSPRPSTNKPRANVTVQFTDATIHPETAQVLSGGQILWIDYAENYQGTVVFPASIKDSFTCSDLRPLFMETAEGYQSIPISEDSENVMLPCPLKAGEYTYEIWLFAGSRADPSMGMGDPQTKIPGKIVVR